VRGGKPPRQFTIKGKKPDFAQDKKKMHKILHSDISALYPSIIRIFLLGLPLGQGEMRHVLYTGLSLNPFSLIYTFDCRILKS
jgi:hypothetical protein